MKQPTKLQQFYSVTEVAEELDITRQSVWRRVQRGTLPASKIGSTWVVPAAVVKSLQMARRRAA